MLLLTQIVRSFKVNKLLTGLCLCVSLHQATEANKVLSAAVTKKHREASSISEIDSRGLFSDVKESLEAILAQVWKGYNISSYAMVVRDAREQLQDYMYVW